MIWYDVDAMKTYFAICSNDNDDVCVTVQMKDGYHSPNKWNLTHSGVKPWYLCTMIVITNTCQNIMHSSELHTL